MPLRSALVILYGLASFSSFLLFSKIPDAFPDFVPRVSRTLDQLDRDFIRRERERDVYFFLSCEELWIQCVYRV